MRKILFVKSIHFPLKSKGRTRNMAKALNSCPVLKTNKQTTTTTKPTKREKNP
jgi:hypothetical protein